MPPSEPQLQYGQKSRNCCAAAASNPTETEHEIYKADCSAQTVVRVDFFRHIRAGNTLTRYTSLEGMSMRSHLCQGDMTRHPSPKRSFSDSWRSETFEYFISDSHIFAAQRSYFSLFIRISLCNQPAGKQDRKLPN